MKKIVLVLILLFSFVGAESDFQKDLQKKLQKGLAKKEKYQRDIDEIVTFMENFKQLQVKQKKSAELFTKYINSHIESGDSCKNLENDFHQEVQNGISDDERELYRKEIQDCKNFLDSSVIMYEKLEKAFNEGLDTLRKIKFKNKLAGKRYKVLESKLKSVNALVDYLNTTK